MSKRYQVRDKVFFLQKRVDAWYVKVSPLNAKTPLKYYTFNTQEEAERFILKHEEEEGDSE